MNVRELLHFAEKELGYHLDVYRDKAGMIAQLLLFALAGQ